MACELCGRSSCMRCFHSLSDQWDFDNQTGAYAPKVDSPNCQGCGHPFDDLQGGYCQNCYDDAADLEQQRQVDQWKEEKHAPHPREI